jgi:hypothetical protein
MILLRKQQKINIRILIFEKYQLQSKYNRCLALNKLNYCHMTNKQTLILNIF